LNHGGDTISISSHKVLTLCEEMDREIGKACEKVYTENSQLWK